MIAQKQSIFRNMSVATLLVTLGFSPFAQAKVSSNFPKSPYASVSPEMKKDMADMY